MSAQVLDGPPVVSKLPRDTVQPEVVDDFPEFERQMIRALGSTVGGISLSKALGYPSQDAFRKAFQRGRVPVITFEIEGRRGRFAAAADIAEWLWRQRHPSPTGGDHDLTPQ